jgi:hypothetical protein
MKRFLTALSFLFLCLLQTANAQSVFPVTVTAQSVPPHTGTLADWAVPGSNRLGATLLLLDAFENAYQVRLKVTIEGNGIQLSTAPGMLPPPITLRYGAPLQITGADLAPYLQAANLNFSGITREQYLSTGSLPEGLYTVCIQAFDYDRSTEKAVSMPACTGIFYQRLDPPVVLLPNVTQATTNPQNIGVQWQPRHGGGFPPTYTVQVFDYNPSGITPQQIIQVNQAFINKTVISGNSCYLTPADPLLVAGRNYIVRVRVQDPTNRHIFNNDGWSEPIVFQYGDPCPTPTGLRSSNITENSARVLWNPRPGFADSWVMRVRDIAAPADQWYEHSTALPRVDLTQLEPETQYVAQVKTICPDGSEGAYSDTITFNTIAPDETPFDCGQSYSLPVVTNHINISNLKQGDIIMVGGFKCTIFTVQRSSRPSAAQAGAWQGFGQVNVPWLKTKINCRFTDLYVNTDKVVYDGNIVANSAPIQTIMDSLKLPVILPEGGQAATTDFCGNNLLPAPPTQSFYNPDMYNQINPNGSNFFVPYNAQGSNLPTAPTYDRYNPFNTTKPYDPYNFKDPNNPYTPQNPYNPYSTWNPYNYLNPYNPNDYSDPANPYSPQNPYNPNLISRQDSLSGLDMIPPPLFNTLGKNIPKFIGNKVKIAIINIRFTPQGAALDAYLRARLPKSDQFAVFKMTNVGFHPGGLLGESKLYLANDLSYTVNSKMKMTLKGGLNTYASWDCNGFIGFSIDGKVVFCQDVLISVNIQTGQPKLMDTLVYQNTQYQMHNYVTGAFRLTMVDLDEFTGNISISPFTMPQLPGWVFTVQEAAFDFSESKTPASMSFPLAYTHPDLAAINNPQASPLWTGVTIKRLQVYCPRKFPFSKGSTTQQMSFGATDLVFDERGVTGDFFAKNLLPLNEGRLATWGASIDSVNISILVNQFRSFTVKGGLLPHPLDDTIGYSCMIQPGGKYMFSLRVMTNREYNVKALRSKFVLFPNTEVTVAYNEVTDVISGSLRINGKAMFFPSVKSGNAAPPANDNPGNNPPPANAKDVLRVPFIQVQGLELSTRAPYILNGGLWQMGGDTTTPPRLSSFPITIKNVGMFANQQQKQVAFVIAAAVNLTSQTEQGLKGEGGIKIICDVDVNPVTKKQSWSFNRVFLDSLSVDYTAPAYKVKGKIIMFENTPAYGSGFQGMLSATFEPRIKVEVAAMYGKMADYSYFFLDAYASFNPGIALGTSGLAIYGFGGGAYYHMQRSVPVTSLAAPYGLTGLPLVPTSLGRTLDGAQYVPSSNILFGIKAKVGLGAIKQEIFNSDVIFEINFNNSGGVNQIGFRGSGRFMTPPNIPGQPPKDPAVRVNLDLLYTIPAQTFHCTMDLFLNVNSGTVTGAYKGNRAGRGVIHYDPSEWYIQLGTPSQRIMINYSAGALQNMLPKPTNPNPADTSFLSIDWAKVGILLTGYFDAGTSLPPFPDLPAEVMNALQYGSYNLASSSTGNGGTGIMFGAAMDIKIPELGFWKFYAKFDAGAGFDVMMRDYGENAYCAGSAPPLGINGWYATGQLYAYIMGQMGVKVSIFGSTKKIPFITLTAGAILQAKLPNPMWARGILGGTYSVLGGLVRGKFRFEFELGKKCDIVGAPPLDGVEVIGSTSPVAGATDVNVFTRPQATFNLPLGHVFQLEKDGVITFYTALIDKFELLDHLNVPVPGTVKWNAEKDVVAITPDDILAGQKQYKLNIWVRFEKSSDGISGWTPVMEGGNQYKEKKEITFTSGDAPDYIPEQNVAYSYPVRNQANFLKNESPTGYLKLVQGQPYLFKNQPEFNMTPASNWQQKARFMQGTLVKGESDLTYDRSNRIVTFAIPAGLPNDAVLKMSLANVPTTTTQAVDANVVTQINTLATESNVNPDEAATLLLRERKAQGSLIELQTKELYSVNLRTSLYNTFAAKVNAMKTTNDWEAPLMFGGGTGLFISQFGITFNGPEYFDQTDIDGHTDAQYEVKPMVKFEATLSQTAQNWYANGAGTNMYNILPNTQIPAPIGRPDTSIMGRAPHRNGAVKVLYANTMPTALTPEQITAGVYPLESNICRLSYRPQYYMKLDEWDFTTQIGDWYTSHGSIPQSWSDFLQWNLPGTPNGNYGTKLKYFLPGQTTPNSVETVPAILNLQGN